MPNHAAAAPSTAYQTSLAGPAPINPSPASFPSTSTIAYLISSSRPLIVHRGNSVLLLASSLITFCFNLCVKKVILKPPAMCSTKCAKKEFGRISSLTILS
ncbi:unnamed protein product [Musa hybrid cultivar]